MLRSNRISGVLLPNLLTSFRRQLASLQDGPDLQDFLQQPGSSARSQLENVSTSEVGMDALKPSVFIKTFGCQMNVNDTELVRSILSNAGYALSNNETKAKVVLLNTCAIRDGAEQKVWGKVHSLHQSGACGEKRTVGILGCMAERLKEKLLDSSLVHVVAGPDSYRDLPRLLDMVRSGGEKAINVQLSADETYADISPVLIANNWYSSQKPVVAAPLAVRGRERSRPMASILEEVQRLSDDGFREITLLGQNVNSYCDFSGAERPPRDAAGAEKWYAAGFQTVYKPNRQGAVVFSELLDRVAQVDPNMRIRFTSPHPKDFTNDVLEVVARHRNVCSHLHMPAQSGSSTVLQRMRRGYSREAYDALLQRASDMVPGATFSTDIIVGFCGETEEDHRQTLDLLDTHKFSAGFLFAYSDRERTHAARHYVDDVPPDVKKRRLAEALAVFKDGVTAKRKEIVGSRQLVLVGESKKGQGLLFGRTEGFQSIQIPLKEAPSACSAAGQLRIPVPGEYVDVEILEDANGRLEGHPRRICSLEQFYSQDRMHQTQMPAAKGPFQPDLRHQVISTATDLTSIQPERQNHPIRQTPPPEESTPEHTQ